MKTAGGVAGIRRLGAIDVGSNSMHLAVAEIGPGDDFEVVEVRRAGLRLAGGEIGPARTALALDALRGFLARCKEVGCGAISAVATDALRVAPDRRAFLGAVDAALGLQIRVLGGAEEARLAWLGASRRLPPGPALLIDLGGGSTELTVGAGPLVLAARSFSVGHVRAARWYTDGGEALVRERVLSAMGDAVEALRPWRGAPTWATGGTAFTLAGMAARARGEVPRGRHGVGCPAAALPPLIDALRRGEEPAGFDARRQDTLLPGAVALEALLVALGRGSFTTCEGGLREGAIVDWIQRGVARCGEVGG